MKNFNKLLVCLVVALLFCIPILKGSFRIGPDTTFHINRIIALATAIKNNDCFPRIFFNQNYNFGYGSPLFYSIIFLYPSAMLSLMGFSPYYVYAFTVFSIAFFSALTMYNCASRIFKTKKDIYVIISVFVYVINLFFLSNIYKRGAIGEGLAYIFLPIIIEGIYEVLYLESNKWQYLVYGFCGLLLSHNITFILMAVIFGVILIIEYKKLNVKKIVYIGMATIFSILITGFFTLMMFEQLTGKLYRISDYFNNTSMVGIDFSGLFLFFNGENVYLNNTVGPILLFLPIGVFVVKKYRSAGFIKNLTIIGYIMIFMTLKFFPWHLFKFMSFLQFPERLLTPVCAFLSLGVGYCLNKVRIRIKNFNLICMSAILIISFLEIGGILFEYGQLTDDFSNDDLSNVEKFYNDKYWYNVLEISSPDYIYKNSQIDFKNYGHIIKTDNEENDKEIFDRSRYNELVFTVGYTKENAYYILPISYYKGYAVDVYEEDKYLMSLNTKADKETGLVKIELPEYNSGKLLKFVCSYKKTNLQIIGEIISKISLCCFLAVLFLKSKVYKWIIGTVYKKHHTQAK